MRAHLNNAEKRHVRVFLLSSRNGISMAWHRMVAQRALKMTMAASAAWRERAHGVKNKSGGGENGGIMRQDEGSAHIGARM